MKTYPQNHYNSITIPSSHYLRHDCICCSANPPPNQPANHPPHHHLHLLYHMYVTKQGEKECSVCISLGMCGEALSSSTFYARSSPPAKVGSSKLTYSYGTAICRGKRIKKGRKTFGLSGPHSFTHTHMSSTHSKTQIQIMHEHIWTKVYV